MHLETYLARPDVGAVIHTHPMYSIALGATVGGLEPLSHDGLLFPDGVPVFDGTAGLVTTSQDGEGVARALGGSRAVLLRNHGILVTGEDISWAVLTALTLERAARIQFIARVLGDPVPIPREVARELTATKYQDEFAEEYWQDWCRMLARSCQAWLDTGAYADNGPRVTATAGDAAPGPYRWQAVEVAAHCVYTNTGPAGSYRAFGASHLQWIGESQLDEVARRLGVDRLEIRHQNLLRPGEEVRPGGKPWTPT
jgi:Molybdopterin-binding domain of aldehyde dehydrogenase/Class II Aldolase and Adducin N-terminal domain